MKSFFNFKKSLMAVVAILVFSISATSVFAYWDVKEDSPYFDAITYLTAQGIVSGHDDGGFHPWSNVNRAEFIKIVIGANFPESEFGKYKDEQCFPDVTPGYWYTAYACFAKAKGIVNGYEDGTFGGGLSINFAEASKMIVNAFGIETLPKQVWYEGYVEALESRNAVPVALTTFDSYVGREIMAEITYRLHAKVTTKPSTQALCKMKGENLGPWSPYNNSYCCDGLEPFLEKSNIDDNIGAAPVCVAKSFVQ